MAWFVFCFVLLFAGVEIQADNSVDAIVTSQNQHSISTVVDAIDEKIYLVDSNSSQIVCSFPSSAPVYSSSPAHDSEFFFRIGDGWEFFSKGLGNENTNAPRMEDLLKSVPVISSHGGVLLGSKIHIALLVNAKNGQIISAFKTDATDKHKHVIPKDSDGDKPVYVNFLSIEKFLYICRQTYVVKCLSHQNGKDVGYIHFSDTNTSSHLDCLGSSFVYRIQDQSSLERLFGLPNSKSPSLPEVYPIKDGTLSIWSQLSIYLVGGVVIVASWIFLGGRTNKLNKKAEEGKMESVSFKRKRYRKAGKIKKTVGVEDLPIKDLATFENGRKIGNIFITNKEIGKGSNGTPVWEGIPLEGKMESVLFQRKRHRKADKIKKSVGVEDLSIKDLATFENGRKIGNIFITNKEIGKGSNGTVVWEGIQDSRPVAVKRLLRTHHDIAMKEVRNLIASDYHPNIVRLYGVEFDQDFVYLSLELCKCSLYEFITSYSDNSRSEIQSYNLQPLMGSNRDVLWKVGGYPSDQLLNIMRDIVSGVAHLHELGIIHRDLKPQNILITKQSSIRAKVSDMGISKCLPVDMSSLSEKSTGCGTSGWQAPEQLQCKRQTQSLDLFSLGCSLFFCITGGQHPYGDTLVRDINILKDKKQLLLINRIPEALHLIRQLLDPNPSVRPKAVDVLRHPFFWDAEMRLSFLRDASDRLIIKPRSSELRKAIENTFQVALGGRWDEKLDSAFINDLGQSRQYKFTSVCDLLRVIRNQLGHYRKLSKQTQRILGQPPQEFNDYFSSRFPRLLIEVYKVFDIYCREEELLSKYFKSKET